MKTILGTSYVHGILGPGDFVEFRSVYTPDNGVTVFPAIGDFTLRCKLASGELLVSLPGGYYVVIVNGVQMWLIKVPGDKATYELFDLIVRIISKAAPVPDIGGITSTPPDTFPPDPNQPLPPPTSFLYWLDTGPNPPGPPPDPKLVWAVRFRDGSPTAWWDPQTQTWL